MLIAIIDIAPNIQSDLKWWLLALGLFLSLVTWFALARDREDAEKTNALVQARHNEVLRLQIAASETVLAGLKSVVVREAVETRNVLVAKIGSIPTALDTALANVESAARVRTRTGDLHLSGYAPGAIVSLAGAIRATSDGLTGLLDVRDNPPRTDKAVRKLTAYLGTFAVALGEVSFDVSSRFDPGSPDVVRPAMPDEST